MYTFWEHQQHEARSRRRNQSQARKVLGQESLVQAHSGLEEQFTLFSRSRISTIVDLLLVISVPSFISFIVSIYRTFVLANMSSTSSLLISGASK